MADDRHTLDAEQRGAAVGGVVQDSQDVAHFGTLQHVGGLASSVEITNQTGYVLFPVPGGEGALLGCQWTVLVLRADS